MARDVDVDGAAEALLAGISLLVRRIRQVHFDGELPIPERSALSRLDRTGPATSAALARQEQISAQSMGATLRALEERGLVERRADPHDGRQVVMSVSRTGLRFLRSKRNERSQLLARTLASGFTKAELTQLMVAVPLLERLAESI